MKKSLVLFDLDGVIIDSRKNMEFSWASVRTDFEIDIPFERYFGQIGRPFEDIMNILGLSDRADEIKNVYDAASSNRQDLIEFFDECIDVLKILKKEGLKIGIVTSKTAERTHNVMRSIDVAFDVIECPDGKSRGKPDPDHLLKAMGKCSKDPMETIYIGDMGVDREAAKRANIDYIHAEWGYGICNGNIKKARRPKDIIKLID